MSKVLRTHEVSRNRLLARLPPRDLQRLVPHLRPVPLDFKTVLYEAQEPIDYVYFPYSGVLSALTIMSNGSAIEVASIGYEGMVGMMALIGADTSPNEMIVQVPGEGLRMSVDAFRAEANREGSFRETLFLYHSAFQTQISYGTACNGLHVVQQRCCRWVLLTQDRVDSDTVPLTHEFLAIMLGVRRSTVTEVLLPLQKKGLIRSGRGHITILDRKGLERLACECYEAVNVEFDRLFGKGHVSRAGR